MASFNDRRAAYEALRAAIANPNDLINDEEEYYRVTPRAICAMEPLARDVTEVVPFLWNLFRTGNAGTTGYHPDNSGPTGFDGAMSVTAFTTLKAIGLRTEDVPTLVERIPALSGSPAFQSLVPQAIADLMARDPQSTVASISALENLLGSPDTNVRVCAACALASTRVDQDQRVAEILGYALSSSDSPVLNRCAVEALAKAGKKAAVFVPSLLELAQKPHAGSMGEDLLRKDVLRAVGKIQPSAVDSIPEVIQVIAGDAAARELTAKLNDGSATFDDLVAALKLPQQTISAASQLGELGTAASKAIPAMIQALSGMDEDQRERIVEAIHRIDPQFPIERVDESTMRDAMLEARIAVESKTTNPGDPLKLLVYDHAKFTTWWTRDEVLSFARQLASRDTDVHRAFVSKVLEGDPSLRDSLAQTEE